MRPISLSACLAFAVFAHGQPPAHNALRLTKYILGVADLDKSYAFYHALGLELENSAALGKPNALPEMLLKLVDVPPGTKFRNMMLKIPNTPFALEVTEFSGMDLRAAKPRIQDPGAALLHLMVGEIGSALAVARAAGGEVVTTGGAPVAGAVVLKDPDGYYVELIQARGVPAGAGKVIGANFSSTVVPDSEKAATFYRDRFGFTMNSTGWSSDFNVLAGTTGAQTRSATVTVPDTKLSWTFLEFKGIERKTYAPRIPDPGAPALGLEVRDIDAAVAAIKAAGGASVTQGGNLKLGNGKVGFVRDPSGDLVELAQP